ncbi:non-ribosomal peptide synthetase [Pollutimonas bauzanensis]|uniref:Amino acid adenylation domain-containing protein n=1 Tax=Pollutimonas bauzanensis TaxID=658167 RepID=A0A1M5W1Z7_9BURK|nr:non-ribosomal peptide synthetase [Pollutimonas bauzanensis]SHH81477.1 amino acid adenylation domain-containing protein [Pollutimonas bauzanensis]
MNDSEVSCLTGSTVQFVEQTLFDRLEAWNASVPDQIALRMANVELSYGGLMERVAATAAGLALAGIRPGDIVAVRMPRSLDLVIAILGVMRTGAAYLPLDEAWPVERCQYILANAAPKMMLVSNVMDPIQWGLATADVSQLAAAVKHPRHVPDLPSPTDAAYVIYTSGSTGVPKGVVVEHAQLLNYAAAISLACGFDHKLRLALSSGVAADLGNTTLYGALFSGATLVVATEGQMQDPVAYSAFIREERIDCLKVVPSQLEVLIEAPGCMMPKIVILGGEPANSALVGKIREIHPSAVIYNHYGPTECTVGVLVHRLGEKEAFEAGEWGLPLSAALSNNYISIRDQDGRLVKRGEEGEIYIAGAQVCRGYLGQLPGDGFVQLPDSPGERFYGTGDLARQSADGRLALTGRIDDQVKIRGYRIALREVELACLRLPGIQQAVVCPTRDKGETELAAYLVGRLDFSVGAHAAARRSLQKYLPDAFIPSYFSVIDEIPRLANGKIDRQKLSSILPVRPGQEVVEIRAVRSGTYVERFIVDAIAGLIGGRRIEIDDDFFDVGLHSLQAIRLAAKIREILRVDLKPGGVLTNRSIRALASHIDSIAQENSNIEKHAADYLLQG